MKKTNTTPLPNALFDDLLASLSLSELKVLLLIFRHTWGKIENPITGSRKPRSWIPGKILQIQSGMSPRSINRAIRNLVDLRFIKVTNTYGESLDTTEERNGAPRLYFEPRVSYIENRKPYWLSLFGYKRPSRHMCDRCVCDQSDLDETDAPIIRSC